VSADEAGDEASDNENEPEMIARPIRAQVRISVDRNATGMILKILLILDCCVTKTHLHSLPE
jgi:hypothetical protein